VDVEYFKQSKKNNKRKYVAEELDSDSEIEIVKVVSNSQKSKKKKVDTNSVEELKKSILKTQKKTISNKTHNIRTQTRTQVIEYRYFAEKKY
jgi:hypothetical protein